MTKKELEDYLWGAANILRGMIDAADFKQYIFPLLFFKRRAYLRKVAVADYDGICSGDILVFRANKTKLLPELLPYYVFSDAFIHPAVTTSAGSLSPRTKWKDLAKMELSIPDLKTQNNIILILQQIQQLLAQLNQQKTSLKNLKQVIKGYI